MKQQHYQISCRFDMATGAQVQAFLHNTAHFYTPITLKPIGQQTRLAKKKHRNVTELSKQFKVIDSRNLFSACRNVQLPWKIA